MFEPAGVVGDGGNSGLAAEAGAETRGEPLQSRPTPTEQGLVTGVAVAVAVRRSRRAAFYLPSLSVCCPRPASTIHTLICPAPPGRGNQMPAWNAAWNSAADRLSAEAGRGLTVGDLPPEMVIELMVTGMSLHGRRDALGHAATGFSRWWNGNLRLSYGQPLAAPDHRFDTISPDGVDVGLWFWVTSKGVAYARPLGGKVYATGLLPNTAAITEAAVPVSDLARGAWRRAESRARWMARMQTAVETLFNPGQRGVA